MEQEIELREIIGIVSKRWKLITALFLLAVAGSYIFSNYYVKPVYRATATILVGRPAEGTQVFFQDVQLGRQLVKTYGEIVRSNMVASAVIEELNLRISADQFKRMLSVSAVRDTELIAISIQDYSPDRAALLANGVAEVFIRQIARIMHIDNLAVIDAAVIPSSPFNIRPWQNMAVAGILAIMAGLFLTFVLEFMDNTVKTLQDVERILKLPVLGSIPTYEGE
ncbi:MAG: putative capsular polysaccharide biosynthesis protein YwqC [Syntrophomonadaceae bacterium]|nr:putative capsular polysaccharide biosynthesis protein YwqC [Bacillota bacterium]